MKNYFCAVDQKSEVGSIEVLIPGNTFELRLDQQLIQKTRLWFNCRFEFRFEKIEISLKFSTNQGSIDQLKVRLDKFPAHFGQGCGHMTQIPEKMELLI